MIFVSQFFFSITSLRKSLHLFTYISARDPQAPFEIIRLYLEAGGKADKCIMSHLDRKSFIIKYWNYLGACHE